MRESQLEWGLYCLDNGRISPLLKCPRWVFKVVLATARLSQVDTSCMVCLYTYADLVEGLSVFKQCYQYWTTDRFILRPIPKVDPNPNNRVSILFLVNLINSSHLTAFSCFLSLPTIVAPRPWLYFLLSSSAKKTDIYEDYVPSNHLISVKKHS
ncbi:hypothetical protein VNO80_26401 [Phaseolus coccineus]|uniref:Uncharacterized protein n=1 Tax=Phaseolus coccineus TaxID=3886 RepID=A0AAN9QH34_PHACN